MGHEHQNSAPSASASHDVDSLAAAALRREISIEASLPKFAEDLAGARVAAVLPFEKEITGALFTIVMSSALFLVLRSVGLIQSFEQSGFTIAPQSLRAV